MRECRGTLKSVPSRRLTPWLLALAASIAACAGGQPSTSEETAVDAPDVITVTSPAFRDGESIPARFTCDGEGGSPPLTWENVPD